MTIAQLGEEDRVIIPHDVREALQLKPGDRLELKVENVRVTMIRQASHTSRLSKSF